MKITAAWWLIPFVWLLYRSSTEGIGAVRIKKTGWFNPYSISDSGVLRATMLGPWTGKAGVYWIRDPEKKVIYVGSSTSQLKKTIYRHFQEWTDRQRSTNRQFDRVVYPKDTGYQVKFFLCSPADALRAEKYFIRKLNPRDNPTKYHGLTEVEIEKSEKAADKFSGAELIADVENFPW